MENNIHIAITQEAQKIQNIEKKLFGKPTILLLNNSIKSFKEIQKPKTIHIFDKGFEKTGEIIPINNHINKTGINPLRENKVKKIQFYDITEIYQKHKQGKIAECYGNKTPIKNKNPQYIQGKYLCNYVILAHSFGFKEIFAYIIN